MRLLVLGASGPLGRRLVEQALERGHEVRAFVRDPARLATRHERLRVVTGDVLKAESLDPAFQDCDAVVSSLGVGMSFCSGGLMTRATPNVISAMEKRSVRRLVSISAFGVGDQRSEAPPLPRVVFGTLLRDIYADKAVADDAVKRSALEWTIVAPVRLTDGPGTGNVRAGERLALHGVPGVSRADVAQFTLDEIEHPRHLRKVVIVAGP